MRPVIAIPALAFAFAALPLSAAFSAANARPTVEVAFVLDTTGSMGGLIEGAKRKIWSIATAIVIEEVARACASSSLIPAVNKLGTVPLLIAASEDVKARYLAPVARELGARVIIVDDGSTDGTADVIREHSRDMHLAIVTHTVNQGLGTAINTGIRSALGESSDDDAIVTLEADTTSDLSDLPRMLELFDQGTDIVLASVYAPGGKIIGVAGWRLAASKSVSNTFRYLGGLREMHTLSSLYRIYRAGTLRKAADTYGYLLVREPGFAANVELLLKLYNAGATVADGELMLLHQGAAAFTLWTGQPAPLDLMQAKLAEARAGGLRSAEGEPTGIAADDIAAAATAAD